MHRAYLDPSRTGGVAAMCACMMNVSIVPSSCVVGLGVISKEEGVKRLSPSSSSSEGRLGFTNVVFGAMGSDALQTFDDDSVSFIK